MKTHPFYQHQTHEYMRRVLPPGETINLVAAGLWSPSPRESMLDKGVSVAAKALLLAAIIASEGDFDPEGLDGDIVMHDPECLYVAGLTARSLVIARVKFEQGSDPWRPPTLATKGLHRFILERDLERIRPLNSLNEANAWPGLVVSMKTNSLRIQFATCTWLFTDNWQRGSALLHALESMRARRAAVRVAPPLAS